MPGILYVVATPIGNLEDVTMRALRILREVSLIAAEDTRRTARLLQHYSISTPTTSLHEHNEHVRASRLVERLLAGESVALVSDAGTPLISDPGAGLVAAAHEAGIKVVPIPGPSAITAVISAAGGGGEGFRFAGFPPPKGRQRRDWLRSLADLPVPLVLYEAPHRIRKTLTDIADVFGDRQVAIGRELTKSHEFLAIRPIMAWLDSPPPELGEFVLVVWPNKIGVVERSEKASPARMAELFWQITENEPLSRREAIRRVANVYGVSTRDVFAAVEAHPKSVE